MEKIQEKSKKMLLEIVILHPEAREGDHFFCRYNHFCGVSCAFYEYISTKATCPEGHGLQIYDSNKKEVK
tara:strand:+ start:322 stop:531 length:210 start_codon:yes stop_codon:yes gene_type:complete